MRPQPSTRLPPLRALAHRVERVLTGLSPSPQRRRARRGTGGEETMTTTRPTPTPTAPAPAPPTQDRTTTGTRGRRRPPRHQTPPLRATARREEGWCIRVMTGRGAQRGSTTTAPPTTAASNCSQGGYGMPRRRCDGVLTRGATQREEPPRHGKEGHDRAPPAFPRVAVYFRFSSFVVIFVIVVYIIV
jgi:hypothetical protein